MNEVVFEGSGRICRPTGNYAGFSAPALVKQEILGDVGSGTRFGRPLDRGIGRLGGASECAPLRSQSDSENASKRSFARNRRNRLPVGATFASAFSFRARFACT
jgi:hypothetical protein